MCHVHRTQRHSGVSDPGGACGTILACTVSEQIYMMKQTGKCYMNWMYSIRAISPKQDHSHPPPFIRTQKRKWNVCESKVQLKLIHKGHEYFCRVIASSVCSWGPWRVENLVVNCLSPHSSACVPAMTTGPRPSAKTLNPTPPCPEVDSGPCRNAVLWSGAFFFSSSSPPPPLLLLVPYLPCSFFSRRSSLARFSFSSLEPGVSRRARS